MNSPLISIIVAIADNNAIGKNNNLLIHLPKDLKWFKENTINKTVIMGRKTFESLPAGPLKERRNIVFSKNIEFKPQGCVVVSDLNQLWNNLSDEHENFVIGGAHIYKLLFPFATKLYITRIHKNFDDADTFFPEINYSEWILESKNENKADEKNKADFDFIVFKKQ